MENLIMHFITVVTLIVMVCVIIGLPYFMGIVIDRIFKINRTDHDPVATWIIGAVGLLLIGLFGSGIYVVYTDIFNYYTKP
jgi:ABC-type multidrug transport system fused ATPase/permease subunit